MKFVFTICSLLGVLAIYGTPLDSIRTEQRGEDFFVVHQVEEEETLYSIARRYKGSVNEIVEYNQISDNKIDIGQLLYVLVVGEESVKPAVINDSLSQKEMGIHLVRAGETLYSISKLYDVKLKNLREWNGLTDNDLSLGMKLKVKEHTELIADTASKTGNIRVEESSEEIEPDSLTLASKPVIDFEKHLVQTGETLSTIAGKIGVTIDSLKFWNNLQSDYIRIGQELVYKVPNGSTGVQPLEPKKGVRSQIDEKGFERIYEEGVTSVIQSMNTSRFLALHRTLPIGTNLEVRNLMNNQIVHVKVVGRLPNTGLNKNLLLRLSRPAYDQLGILDSKSRVEVSYYRQ